MANETKSKRTNKQQTDEQQVLDELTTDFTDTSNLAGNPDDRRTASFAGNPDDR